MIDATMLWPLCQIIARCEIAVAGDYRPHASRRSRLHIPFRIAHIQTSCRADAEQLGGLGLLAPTTFLAANLGEDAISHDLAVHTIDENLILGAE